MPMRISVASAFSVLLVVPVTLTSFPQEKIRISKIVIDAGHGGKDPGTLGKKTQEKTVTLAIALRLGRLIRENMKGETVLYTREADRFIELHERANIANRNQADLFISVHCNANRSQSFHGAETYIMGLHRTEANLEIAKLENASILMEPDYAVNYEGFDPNSDESYITFTLFQNAYLDQSTELAAFIQDELKDRVGLNDRGVRQAGFLVLYKTTMPSVLVETGFLSNPDEENFLVSEKGQEYVAGAIFRAIRRFKNQLEGVSGTSLAKSDPAGETPGQLKEKTTPAVENTGKTEKGEICFRIQVAASPKELDTKSSRFRGLADVRVYRHQGMFKYTTGNEPRLEDALKLLSQVKKKGFKDAFVVAFRGDQRITIEEAKKANKQ
jgi:N-acetylmuramoyl-L-alanine amidase